jgi:hypothetical protein
MVRFQWFAMALLTLGSVASAKEVSTGAVGAAMTEAAQKFLAVAEPEERAKGALKFDDPARLDWHNIPKPERKGVQVREMDAEERAACHALLKAGLSPTGYDKVVKIMALENNLREGEKNLKGGHLRDPERFFLTIFGEPATTGTWGWSFEGHHLSLNFVIRDGAVISDTPSFWGANPATVRTFVEGGPQEGTRTLAAEEQLAFDLVNALDDKQLERAVISEKAPNEYRAAGKPQPPQSAPEGLAAAEMNDTQKKILRSLLAEYCGHLADPLAAARVAEIEAQDSSRVHFAWMGSTKPGVGHAYRIQGPTFVLELVNIQSDPAGNPANHIHSVWRSMQGDFAVSAK